MRTATEEQAGGLLGHKMFDSKHKTSLKLGNASVLTTQQALPRSAILTCNLSALTGSKGFTNILPDAPVNVWRGRSQEKVRNNKREKC